MTQPDGIFTRILPKIREFFDDKSEQWKIDDLENRKRLRNQARNYSGSTPAGADLSQLSTPFGKAMAAGAAGGPIEEGFPHTDASMAAKYSGTLGPQPGGSDPFARAAPGPVTLDPNQRFAPTAPTPGTDDYQRIPGLGDMTASESGLEDIRTRGTADYIRSTTQEQAPPAIDPTDPLSPPLSRRSVPMENEGLLGGGLDVVRFAFGQVAEGILQTTEQRLEIDDGVKKVLSEAGVPSSVTSFAQQLNPGRLISQLVQMTGARSFKDVDDALKGVVVNRSEVPHWLIRPIDTYNYVRNMPEDESVLDYFGQLHEDYSTRAFAQQLITELAVEIVGTKGIGLISAVTSPRQIKGITSFPRSGFKDQAFDASTLTQQRHLYDDPQSIHSPFQEGRILQPGQYDPTVTGPRRGAQWEKEDYGTVTGGMFTQGDLGYTLEIPSGPGIPRGSEVGFNYNPVGRVSPEPPPRPMRYYEMFLDHETGKLTGSIREMADTPGNRQWIERHSFANLRANGRVIIPDDGGVMPVGKIQTARRLLAEELDDPRLSIHHGPKTPYTAAGARQERILAALDEMDEMEYQHLRESLKPGVPVSDFSYQTYYGKYRNQIKAEREITELWEAKGQAYRRLNHYRQYGFSRMYDYPKTPLFKLAGAPNMPVKIPDGPVRFSTRSTQGKESFTVNYNDYDFGDPIQRTGTRTKPTIHRDGSLDYSLKERGTGGAFIGQITDASVEDELLALARQAEQEYLDAVATQRTVGGTWHNYEAARQDYEDALMALDNTSDRIQTGEDFADIINGKLQRGEIVSPSKADEYFFLQQISEQIGGEAPKINVNKFIYSPVDEVPIPMLQSNPPIHPSIQFIGKGSISAEIPQNTMSQNFIKNMPLTQGEGHAGYRFIDTPARWVRNDELHLYGLVDKEITRMGPTIRLGGRESPGSKGLIHGQVGFGEEFEETLRLSEASLRSNPAPIMHSGPSQYGYGLNITPSKIGREEFLVGEPNGSEWTLLSLTEIEHARSLAVEASKFKPLTDLGVSNDLIIESLNSSPTYHMFRNMHSVDGGQLANMEWRIDPVNSKTSGISNAIRRYYPNRFSELVTVRENGMDSVNYDALAAYINANPSPIDLKFLTDLSIENMPPGSTAETVFTAGIQKAFKPKMSQRFQDAHSSTIDDMRIMYSSLRPAQMSFVEGAETMEETIRAGAQTLYRSEVGRINIASKVKKDSEIKYQKQEYAEDIYAPKWVFLASDYNPQLAVQRTRQKYPRGRQALAEGEQPPLEGRWWSKADVMDNNIEGHLISSPTIRGRRKFNGAGNDFNTPGTSPRSFIQNSLDDKFDVIDNAKSNVHAKRNALDEATSKYTGPDAETRAKYNQYQQEIQQMLFTPSTSRAMRAFLGETPPSERIGDILDMDYSRMLPPAAGDRMRPPGEGWYKNDFIQPQPRRGAVRTTGEAATLQPMYTEPLSGINVPQLRGPRPTPGTGPIEGTPTGRTGTLPSGLPSGTDPTDYFVRGSEVYTADGRILRAGEPLEQYSSFGGKWIFNRNSHIPYEIDNAAERVMFRGLIEKDVINAAKAYKENINNTLKSPNEPISFEASQAHYKSIGRIPGTAGTDLGRDHTPVQESAITRLIEIMARVKELRPQVTAFYNAQKAQGVARQASFFDAAIAQSDEGLDPYSDPDFLQKAFGMLRQEKHGLLQFTDGAFETPDIAALYQVINESGELPLTRTNALGSLSKLLRAEVPTPSEIKILERIFGAQHADALKESYDIIKSDHKIWEAFLNAYMVPRVLKSTIDMSAMLRQGLYLSAGHPKSAANASLDMLKATFRPKKAHEIDEGIRRHPYYEQSQMGWKADGEGSLKPYSGGAKLYIADIQGGVNTAEEAFMSSFLTDLGWLGKFPGISRTGTVVKGLERINPVAAAERAYTTFLNKLRMDVYGQYARKIDQKYPLGPNGVPSQEAIEAYQQAASFINAATGRGNLPRWIAQPANLAFFSPRFQVSRLEFGLSAGKVLKDYALMGAARYTGEGGRTFAQKYTSLNPVVRRMMLKDAVGTLAGVQMGVMLMALGIRSVLPEEWERNGMTASYEHDPRHPRFAQLRLTLPGGRAVQYDMSGGMSVLIRYTAQAAARKQIALRSGVAVEKELQETIVKFIRSKLHPTPGYAWSAIEKQTFTGDPTFPGGVFTPESAHVAGEALVYPMIVEEFMDIYNELDTLGWGTVPRFGGALAGTIPSFLGIGSQAFHNIVDVQNTITHRLYPHLEQYDDANDNQRAQINAHPLVIEEKKKQDAKKVENARDIVYADKAAYRKSKDVNLYEFRELSKIFPEPGKGLRESIRDYKFASARISDIFLNESHDAILNGERPGPLLDEIRDGYHGITLNIDQATGEPSFIQWKFDRQQWIDVGVSLGFSAEEIVSKTDSRFPPEYETEAALIIEYEEDMDELAPYFELGAGLPAAQKTALRQAAQMKNPRFLYLLQKWEFKLLPGQRRLDEISRINQEQGALRRGPTISRHEIFQSLGR